MTWSQRAAPKGRTRHVGTYATVASMVVSSFLLFNALVASAGANDVTFKTCNSGGNDPHNAYVGTGTVNYRYGGFARLCFDPRFNTPRFDFVRLYVKDSAGAFRQDAVGWSRVETIHDNRVGSSWCGWYDSSATTGGDGTNELFCKYYRH